jgi:hypothetical protein
MKNFDQNLIQELSKFILDKPQYKNNINLYKDFKNYLSDNTYYNLRAKLIDSRYLFGSMILQAHSFNISCTVN